MLGSVQVEKDLQSLYPGAAKEMLCTEYYVKKIAMFLMICFVGSFLAVMAAIQVRKQNLISVEGKIARGTFREEVKEIELEAMTESGHRGRFQIPVEAQVMQKEEADELYQQFAMQLPELILGRNASLQEVSEDLVLQTQYEGFPFSLEWKSQRPDILTGSGILLEVEEEVETMLEALLTYEEWEWRISLPVCVKPPVLSVEESWYLGLQEELEATELKSRSELIWQLPEIYRGEKIAWKHVAEDKSLVLWLGAIVAGIAVFFFSDKDLHDKLEKKKQDMKHSYADVVQKLALYLGAGLTVKAAFQKLTGEYERKKVEEKKIQPIYEEIAYTCREIQAGVSEGAAYEHFGKRTGLQEYMRLSTLLMQNLKKGNSTLLQRLREEADRACIEQLQNSRKLGEEAVTKLLLPMVMMLVVVMLLIMIPAFASTGI